MSSSRLYLTRLVAPKRGSTDAECEDAAHVAPDLPFDEPTETPLAVGLSDGATESVLAKDWARILAESAACHALKSPEFFDGDTGFEGFARASVALWEPWLNAYAADRAEHGRPLQWYETAKLAAGASATLLALHIEPATDGCWHWNCAALGDSCLFHLRDGSLLRSFPVQQSEEFGVTPDLFGSRNHNSALLAARTRFTSGDCVPGDRLLLMTDAMSDWFLSSPSHAEALADLSEFSGPHDTERFSRWLDELRDQGSLRNDDVAVVRIDIEGR